jgi:phage shock protein A
VSALKARQDGSKGNSQEQQRYVNAFFEKFIEKVKDRQRLLNCSIKNNAFEN